jgi:hypothetical protein
LHSHAPTPALDAGRNLQYPLIDNSERGKRVLIMGEKSPKKEVKAPKRSIKEKRKDKKDKKAAKETSSY